MFGRYVIFFISLGSYQPQNGGSVGGASPQMAAYIKKNIVFKSWSAMLGCRNLSSAVFPKQTIPQLQTVTYNAGGNIQCIFSLEETNSNFYALGKREGRM